MFSHPSGMKVSSSLAPSPNVTTIALRFAAYADSALDAAARQLLADRVQVTAKDDSTVTIRFTAPDPEQWYDATWHVRILPRHLWDSLPLARWASDTSVARLVGSGPYRLTSWSKGQSLTLERAGNHPGAPAIPRVVWRFAGEQDAALNLLLSHEASVKLWPERDDAKKRH